MDGYDRVRNVVNTNGVTRTWKLVHGIGSPVLGWPIGKLIWLDNNIVHERVETGLNDDFYHVLLPTRVMN